MIYLTIITLLFCIVFFKIYIKNFKREYFEDKKYIWSFTIGLCLFEFFMIGSLFDYYGYIKFIKYFFPLWAIGPTMFLYGLRRLMVLQMEKEIDNYNITLKKFNVINNRMNTLYVICVLSVFLLIFAIIDGRI